MPDDRSEDSPEPKPFDRQQYFLSARTTVKSVDRIYILHEGEIVDDGSHAELVAQAGIYAELFELQAAAYR